MESVRDMGSSLVRANCYDLRRVTGILFLRARPEKNLTLRCFAVGTSPAGRPA